MDIARPDVVRNQRRRRIVIGLAGLFLLALGSIGLSRLKPALPCIDGPVYSDTVKRGSMLREVRGNGTLVPEEILWVTATSPGRIERLPLLPGVTVSADTVLVQLSNPELEQARSDAESEVQAAEAGMEKLRIQLESDRLGQVAAVASLKSELAQAKIEAETDEALRKQGLLPSLTAKRSRARADELELRYQIEQKRLVISDTSAEAQAKAQQAQLVKLRKQYKLKVRQVEALTVRAGVDGVLQRLGDERPAQVGQQVSTGANIARIANPTKLKAQLRIPETQAGEIQFDQQAQIDTRNGIIPGHVMRIDPVVQDGTVTIDIKLDGALPKGARPDLSVGGTVTLERLEDVLYVGRPVNGQSEAVVNLFKILEGAKVAVRVRAKLGRYSVSSVEIVEGLQPGDLIILSDMSRWAAQNRIRLK
jgi:HlyD family secretion protein